MHERDVKALRKRLGLSQADFAKEFFVDQSTISIWERDGLPDRGLVTKAFDDLARLAAKKEKGTAPQAAE